MLIVISYDINTRTDAGKKRLRLVAKACGNHAQRIQQSVYEACIDWRKFVSLRDELIDLIDPKEDSIVFYRLGRGWRAKIERVGNVHPYDPEGLLMA